MRETVLGENGLRAKPAARRRRASLPRVEARTGARFLLAVLVGSALPAFASATATPPGSAAAASGSQDAAALDAATILARAAERQGPPRKDDVLAFSLRMRVQYFDPGTGDELEFLAERRYLEPRIWTQIDDSGTGTSTIECFDGESAWAQIGEDFHRLEGPDYQVDRARLRDDRAQTQLLLRLFFLSRLPERTVGLHRLDDESGFGRTCYVIEGDTELPEGARAWVSNRPEEPDAPAAEGSSTPPRVKLRLWIDQENWTLLGARVEDLGSDGPDRSPLQLCFWDWTERTDAPSFPRSIKIYRAQEPRPRLVLYPSRVNFSPKLGPEDFRPTRKG